MRPCVQNALRIAPNLGCLAPLIVVSRSGQRLADRKRQNAPCRAEAKGFGPPVNLADTVQSRPHLPPIPDLQGKDVRANWNAVALAFLGDTVWELYARRRFFYPPSRTTTYYERVVEQVCAETQERYLEQLLAGPLLTDEERDIIRWGKNAKISIPKRFSQSGKHSLTYRAATAMECLVGYLYLTDAGRLHQLMTYIGLGDTVE